MAPPSDTPASDLDLIRASLGRDARAVKRLMGRLECVPRIIATLNRRFGAPLPESELADLSQDVILLVWERRQTFEGRARLETWVYRYCYLEFMNRFRKSKRRKTLSVQELPGLDERLTAAPVATGHDFEDLELALAELGPPEEEVVRLKHFEELTFREIGERLDISPNSVKTQYYRGIEWLRARLAAEVDGTPL